MNAGPAEYQRAFDELRSDELMIVAAKRMLKKGKPTSVLDYLGEQRNAAFIALAGKYEMDGFREATDAQLQRAQPAIGYALRHSVPFMWTHEMRMVSLGYNLPAHVTGPGAFPHLMSWWSYETAIGYDNGYQADGHLIARNSELRAAGLNMTSEGWTLFEFGSRGPDIRTARPTLTLVWSIPDGTDSAVLGDHGAILGMAAFLNSHAVEVAKQRPGDTDTRWRGRRVGDPASLNVVMLRSTVREAVATERGQGPAWKQRWLVRGHLRAQWYPSLKSHKIVWIAPYLKGPEDAPVKVPIYRVAR